MASRKKPTKAQRDAERKRLERNEQRRIAYAKKKREEKREAARLERDRLARNAKRRADYAAKKATNTAKAKPKLVEPPASVKPAKGQKPIAVKVEVAKKEKTSPLALPVAEELKTVEPQISKADRIKARKDRNDAIRARNAEKAARREEKANAREKARQEAVLREREERILKATPDEVAEELTEWEEAPVHPKPESLEGLLRDANKAAEIKGLSDVWFEDGRLRAEDGNGRDYYGYMVTNTETGNQRIMFSALGEMGFHTPKTFGEKYEDTTEGFEFAFEWEDMFYASADDE